MYTVPALWIVTHCSHVSHSLALWKAPVLLGVGKFLRPEEVMFPALLDEKRDEETIDVIHSTVDG